MEKVWLNQRTVWWDINMSQKSARNDQNSVHVNETSGQPRLLRWLRNPVNLNTRFLVRSYFQTRHRRLNQHPLCDQPMFLPLTSFYLILNAPLLVVFTFRCWITLHGCTAEVEVRDTGKYLTALLQLISGSAWLLRPGGTSIHCRYATTAVTKSTLATQKTTGISW